MTTIYDILDEYALVRAKRAQEVERLRRKNSEPPLLELDEKRRELLMRPIRGALFGEPFDKDENDRLLDKTYEQMALLGGCPDPDRTVPYRCEKCEDTGYLQNGDMCGCLKKRLYKEVYGAFDIDVMEGSFESFDISLYEKNRGYVEKMVKTLKAYADKYEELTIDTVVLSGQVGVGKSFILSSIAKKAEHREEGSVMYISAFSLFSDFHANRLGELADLDPIYKAKMLIVDDLGAEQMTQNVTLEYIFHMLELRKAGGLATVFATNLERSEIKNRYTEKVFSRLFSKTSLYYCIEERDLRLR